MIKSKPEVHKRYPSLELAEKAALNKMESLKGGIMNHYTREDVVIGYKIIPPVDSNSSITVYKI